MLYQDVQIGMEVVRSKGDYVVGRRGEVVDMNPEKQRVQVAWKGETTTWVSVDSVEPTSTPYTIIASGSIKAGAPWDRKPKWPLYKRI